jgi:hypothetical protein
VKNIHALSPEKIAHLLRTLETLNQIGEAVKAHAIRLAHEGVEIPGYEADFTPPRRAWADEEQANKLLEKLGLEKRDRYSVELLSPAQAEKALKAKGLWPKKPRGSAAADFTDPFTKGKVLSYTDTKPTIRRVSEGT